MHPAILPQDDAVRSSSAFVEPEKTTEYWHEDGQNNVRKQLLKVQNKKVAKNVILFLGDGMGISTITAARIYAGQLKGKKGEEAELAMDKFPTTGISKVNIFFLIESILKSCSPDLLCGQANT